MTIYDPYTALLDASSPVSSSPSSSRPSTSSSHAAVTQQGERQKPHEKPHQQCLPPPPYSPTFHQHPSLRTTIFEPASFEHGVLGGCQRCLEGQALNPTPSSPTLNTIVDATDKDTSTPPSPTRLSVTFSPSTAGPSQKTTASHHSRPPSRTSSTDPHQQKQPQ
ncbi:hypothetical protein GTA08_BOTSDO09930 [Botryosphaeria dothidea]|uniref:Uncharacterized protein n=1 Tax=Botryosphaeria dothidea TaxID=55169 RepID=A0A8H4IJV6_9PEZI|nr:hypothetical protein GTA08_BOTSDO09930 [Botryosphaeria dothidea]